MYLNIFEINTYLFSNSLESLSEEQANLQISPNTNNIKWLAAHIIWVRYLMSSFMGNPPDKNPYEGIFDNYKPINTSDDFKSLEEIKKEWEKSTKLLESSFSMIESDFWEKDSAIIVPIQIGKSNASLFSALAQHESTHIGQMAILKKYITGIPMKLSKE
jgi:hypothetical protein